MKTQKLIAFLKRHRWNIQGFNGIPLYLHCAASESGWLVNKKFGLSYRHFFYLFSKGRAYMYYDEDDWERMSDLFYEKVKTVPDFNTLEKQYSTDYVTYIKASEFENATLHRLSNEDLFLLINRLFDRLIYATNYAHVIEGVTFGSYNVSENGWDLCAHRAGGAITYRFICTTQHNPY